ncbi:MAG: FmdB family zinc ribbon protein [Candidatus Promineifilaceae bacterium]|nr:FmdB family zinc ribbon protein [Candidatus Promineifilaceae bacterium]
MPTYVYRCNDCDYTFEARQRMSDAPLTDCPDCPEGEVRRVINPVGIVFKGSGFYVTDARGGKNGSGEAESAKTPAKETAESSGESTTKSETTSTKPETPATETKKKKEKAADK